MGMFDVDGGIMKTLGKITDIICLSVFFVICSLPIFTMGTAATALYYTVNKVIRNERGYIFREYVSAFKSNFKQTTPIWLLVIVISLVLGFDGYVMRQMGQNGSKLGAFGVVFIIMGLFLLAWALYLFAYMARFENTRKQSMKNALLIALVNLPWTAVIIILALACMSLLYVLPISLIFVPGVFTLLESFILEKIFWKYMSEEDREAELERKRECKN
ncbi:MAG: YesL family protein [Clostridiales bacterium]|nr:YesL family protein [Clostridiales bacterium]